MTMFSTPGSRTRRSPVLFHALKMLVVLAMAAPAFGEVAGVEPAAPKHADDRMAWFKEAKLGIFLHWGIYSQGIGSESWAFRQGETTYEAYMAQAKTFTASAYNPDAWAELFGAAGARYVVLTSKHHDGFALWDTKYSTLNAKDSSPAGRDLVGPYADALRRHGLKVGLYFSHLDWSHPDYASILPPNTDRNSDPKYKNRFSYPQGPENPAAWERFLTFHRGQLEEISTRFHPDLLWFDGDWERSDEQWRFRELREQLLRWNPTGIINARIGRFGDYATPEQYIPLVAPKEPWEMCATINDSWGYQIKDHNFKSIRQCVWLLAECAGMGGNLLLDVGPRSDGSIPPEAEAVLRGLGRWTKKSAEGLYGTVAGLPPGYFYGPTTLSKDRDVIYLFCFDRPRGPIPLKGIRNEVVRVIVLGGPELTARKIGGASWIKMPGVLWIDVPEATLDQDATVIKVQLKGPLDLAAEPLRPEIN
jgi:alpha-L-fucosidase